MSVAHRLTRPARLLLAACLLAPASAQATGAPTGPAPAVVQQTGSVSGVVVDAATQRPLPGAQIVVEGTDRGTLTDANGRFLIPGLTGAQVTLRTMMLGYRTATETVNVGATNLQVALRQTAIELDAVVVTGTPGATQKRAIGNSVEQVQTAQLMEKAPVTNVQSLLSGRVAGVNVISSSGNVGAGGVMRIRGVSSISLSSEPLIYVDGVRVNNNASAGPTGMRESRPASRFNDFNPEEIESIEVIKGPAAATLYGTEASNGVIQIITKKGAAGAPKFDVTVKQGINFFFDPEGRLPKGYRVDRGQSTEGMIVERSGGLLVWSAYGQEKELGQNIFQNGPVQSYALNVTGGTDRVRYFLAGEFDDSEGYVSYNTQEKTSGRGNLTVLLTDEVDVNASFGMIRGETRFAQAAAPYGIWDGIVWGHADRQRNRGWYTAPPEELSTILGQSEIDRTTVSVQTNWRPWEWLAQRLTVGADVGSEVNTRLFPRHPNGASHYFGSLSLGDKRLEGVNSVFTTFDYSATGSYQRSQDLKFATSVGFQYYGKRFHNTESNGRIFPTPSVTTVGGAAVTFGAEDLIENKTVGMYVQEQIDWRNRVFLTAAVRGDDNSAFGQNYDFVVYPKVSATWVVNEEPFWRWDWVNALKLRAAWGQAGQQPDVFAAIRLYEPTTGPGNESAIRPSNIGNPDLKPEVGEEIEVGFDASLFEDRLGANFTLYRQKTRDAIIERPLPLSLGFPGTQFVNIGEVRNDGFEVALNAELVQRPRANWSVSFTVAQNENEVTSMGGLPSITGAYQQLVEGYPIMGYWKVEIVSADLDANNRSSNVMCRQVDGGVRPCAESAPRLYQGPETPKWEGALNSTITLFQNLSLFANVEYKTGYYRGDGDVGHGHMLMGATQAIVGHVDGTPPDPIARAYFNLSPGDWGSAMFIHQADFARLREVSASYNLPRSLTSRFKASRATLNVSARNLWFLWRAEPEIFGHPVIDPETRGKGTFAGQTQTVMAPMSTLLASVRVSF